MSDIHGTSEELVAMIVSQHAALEAKDAEIKASGDREVAAWAERDSYMESNVKLMAEIAALHFNRGQALALDAENKSLMAEIVKWKREAGKYTAGCEQCEPKDAEIERLTAAKKAALKIADERGRENVELRAEIGWLTARRDSLAASCAKYAAEVAKLRAALKNIAYVGKSGSPVDKPEAVSKWCAMTARIALEQRVTSPIDRGNAIIRAQEAMRDADDRPSEEIILDQRDEWRS